ncbi:hypothetical protein V5O48_010667, partial [Marasmius crinis-equi]
MLYSHLVKENESDDSLVSLFSIVDVDDCWPPLSPSLSTWSTGSTRSSQSTDSSPSTSIGGGTLPRDVMVKRDSEQANQAMLPKLPLPSRPSCYFVYVGYTKKVVQMVLDQLSSNTTDYKTLVEFLHFRDRTPILKLTREHEGVLFRAPARYGKTSAISMLNYFYDFRFASTFADNFQYTDAEVYESQEHNDSYVLNLDFGQLRMEDCDFDLDKALNAQLDKFVADYSLFTPVGHGNVEYRDPIAAQTFNNIMENVIQHVEPVQVKPFKLVICIDDYDVPYWKASELESVEKCRAVRETLGNFFQQIARWRFRSCLISLVFLTGQTSILPFLPGLRSRLGMFDIEANDCAGGVYRFNDEDVRWIGRVLNHRFHSLNLDKAANHFIESREAKEENRESGFLGYSYSTVLHFYRNFLEDAAKEV